MSEKEDWREAAANETEEVDRSVWGIERRSVGIGVAAAAICAKKRRHWKLGADCIDDHMGDFAGSVRADNRVLAGSPELLRTAKTFF